MKYASQLFGGASSIGSQKSMSEVSTVWVDTLGDQSTWLRSGTLALSASYPEAAAVDYLKCHGLVATQTSQLNPGKVSWATNGLGKWVATFGDVTNNLVSVDNGQTWALVAHNAGAATVSVCYSAALDMFICAGNSISSFYVATRPAATVTTAWTNRTGTTFVNGTADTAKVRASATEVLITCIANNAGAAQVSYSTNGTSWAAKNFSTGLSIGGLINLQNAGGSVWVTESQGSAQRSTDGGQTWAASAMPATMSSLSYYAGVLSGVSSAGVIYKSIDGGQNWTSLGAPFQSNKLLRHFHDGQRYIATILLVGGVTYQPAFYYSTDLLSWLHRGIANKPWSDTIETVIGSDGTNLIMLPSGSAKGGLYGQFANVDAVGLPYPVFPYATASTQAQQTTYVKVKR